MAELAWCHFQFMNQCQKPVLAQVQTLLSCAVHRLMLQSQNTDLCGQPWRGMCHQVLLQGGKERERVLTGADRNYVLYVLRKCPCIVSFNFCV